MHLMESQRHWNLTKLVVIFIKNFFISFFETALFIWLNPLGPRIHLRIIPLSVFHYAEIAVRRCSSK